MSSTVVLEATEATELKALGVPSPVVVQSKSSPSDLPSLSTPGSATPTDESVPVVEAFADSKTPSMLSITLTILQPAMINFLCSFTNGIITVGLPSIARSLELPRSLYLWPTSVWGLTSGSMLLIAGSLADLLGPRRVELVGITLLGCFTLGCGLAATGEQLVIFRALQGVAMAMHLPSAVSIVAAGVPRGKARNIGFASLGLSQPLGFSVGLVGSGVMIERIGWRFGFYLSGAATLAVAVAAMWLLPEARPERRYSGIVALVKVLYAEIDWVGGTLASGGLAILAYVLAIISADLNSIHSGLTAGLLATSVVLLLAFPIWMHLRERAQKPALIPNSLWKNLAFASTCAMVAIANGVMNSMELFSSLYFQEVQKASLLSTSLYLLPNLLVGVVINLSMGLFVHRLPARWLVTISSFLCALAPLMMALVPPEWNYWLLEFWAQILAPMSGDVLFTVGLIIVSDNFPEETQALAGAVFNTLAQFGNGLGVGVCQVIALGVAGTSSGGGHGGQTAFEDTDVAAVLAGYRASFWAMFGLMVLCGLIAVIGLKRAGKVGVKRE